MQPGAPQAPPIMELRHGMAECGGLHVALHCEMHVGPHAMAMLVAAAQIEHGGWVAGFGSVEVVVNAILPVLSIDFVGVAAAAEVERGFGKPIMLWPM